MLLAVPFFGGPAGADILPIGHRGVAHELVLDAPAAVIEGWQLVAAPWPGLVGVTPVELGAPFRFSSKYGTRLYAVARDEALPQRFEAAWAEGRPSADFGVAQVASVPLFNPLQRVTTSLELVEIRPAGIELRVVGEERQRDVGELLFIAAFLLLPLLLALSWLWRLRVRRLRMERLEALAR